MKKENYFQTKRISDCESMGKEKENLQAASKQITSHINFHTLPIKLSLFFDMGKEGATLPFYMLFFMGVGLDTTEAGLVCGLRFAGYMLGGPFWGYLTDSRKNHHIVLIILCVVGMFSNCLQPLVAIRYGDPKVNQCPTPNITIYEEELHKHKPHFKQQIFYILLALNIFTAFFDGSTTSVVDAGAVKRIETSKQKTHYGREKILAPVGYSVAVVLATKLADCFPIPNLTCYSSIFVTHFIMASGLAVCSYFLFNTTNEEKEDKAKLFENEDVISVKWKEDERYLRKMLQKAIFRLDTLIFFITVLITGTLNHLYNSFSIVFLQEIQAPNLLLGLSLVAGAISSSIAFSCAHNIIEFLGGPVRTMAVCLVAWFLRYISLANLVNPWFVLLINLTNSFGFAVMTTAYIENVKLICDEKVWTTMYGILHAMFLGVSGLISHVAGGILYETFGGRQLFTACSYLALGWAIFLTAYVLLKKRNYSSLRKNDSKSTFDSFLHEDKSFIYYYTAV